MKIAVIGGGTAGYLAGVHLTKTLPQFELIHIYDPNIPSVGVGEGTTPDFQDWMALMTGTSVSELRESCDVTQKFGIRFENWGRSHTQFMHNFYPIDEQYAYHISAKRMVTLLREHMQATPVHKRVARLDNSWEGVTILFTDGSELQVDFVFDARGFPRELNPDDHLELRFVPTNAALIRSAPPVAYTRATRSVARPYGWIFIIPLAHRTSYGYIYNNRINTPAEVAADFDAFLTEENVQLDRQHAEKRLTFPSFVRQRFLEDSVFTIGNTASFVEPLEATSISFILTQIKVACRWPLQRWAATGHKGGPNAHNAAVTNRYLRNYLRRMAFFIGWHYMEGSRFDTPFWRFAQANFRHEASRLENQDLVQDFQRFIRSSASFPNPLREAERFAAQINQTFDAIAAVEQKTQRMQSSPKFGLFSELSFAEVGHGMGYSFRNDFFEEGLPLHLMAA